VFIKIRDGKIIPNFPSLQELAVCQLREEFYEGELASDQKHIADHILRIPFTDNI
jgi:hypothetical protein